MWVKVFEGSRERKGQTDQQRLDEAVVDVVEAFVDGSPAVLGNEERFDLAEQP